ncbi:MAG: glutamate 5-kinase [Treponema sp.]|jgi:glutamate 5-kinase|nr:glutamate 5-kinase [Treponema sp.]
MSSLGIKKTAQAEEESRTIQGAIRNARKIVIKIGSNTLAKTDGTADLDFMKNFAAQCHTLADQNKQFVLVSSGAQVSGLSTISGWARKRDVHYRQALCAIGQVELMKQWRDAFAEQNMHIGQLLLTKEDFEDDHRTLNMRNTLFTLVDEGVVPIINENDSVSFDEIRIGDNDNLSALTAILWSADLLILFSDIDGIYTDNPKTDKNAKLIKIVPDIDRLKETVTIGTANTFGTGGIATKIDAARLVTSYGIPLILANGKNGKALTNLAEGNATGTLFLADDKCLLHVL